MHGQVRRLLKQREEWDHDAWGVRLSAAHLGYAAACFAARSITHSKSLGARYSEEEQASFHAVWRYSAHLMGVPESILFTDESHARHIYRIGSICEPPPTPDAIIMTNALINSAPLVAGIEDARQRNRLVQNVIYPVSRGLIGNHLADQLNFPANRYPFPLLWYRTDQHIQKLKARFRKEGSKDFMTLLVASAYNDAGLSYRLPAHARAEESGDW